MSTQDEFLQQVRDALNHLYDYTYLESHPLAVWYWPGPGLEGPSRAQRLHRLLLESIEELHLPSVPQKDTSRARGYFLLAYRYVEEWPLPDIMRELGYSRRQFFREQSKAVAMLAALLKEKLPRDELPPAASSAETDDLLAAEAKRMLAQHEAVDLAEMVQGVLQTIRPLAERRGVTLEYTPDQPLPPILGNRTLLRQIFLNGLSSLITQPGSTRRVHLRMYRERQLVTAELISDLCGPGDHSPGTVDGHAPDLDPVRRLVEVAGGHWSGIEIGSERCTYRFSFPTGDQKVLLVVEDNEAVIRAFRRFLAGYNYRVVGATTGDEALQRAREVNPLVITLDVMMPDQDGWEVLQALKDDPGTQYIPVIICSVLEDPELALSLGAAAYLRKPVTQADLLAALDNLLGTS
jgi:CheY-like chemotaxis protein